MTIILTHMLAATLAATLAGFDISPPKPENFIQEKLSNAGGIYVVQATKKEVIEIEEGKEEEVSQQPASKKNRMPIF